MATADGELAWELFEFTLRLEHQGEWSLALRSAKEALKAAKAPTFRKLLANYITSIEKRLEPSTAKNGVCSGQPLQLQSCGHLVAQGPT